MIQVYLLKIGVLFGMNFIKIIMSVWKNRKMFEQVISEGKDVLEKYKNFRSEDSDKGKKLSTDETQILLKEFSEVLVILSKLVGVFKK